MSKRKISFKGRLQRITRISAYTSLIILTIYYIAILAHWKLFIEKITLIFPSIVAYIVIMVLTLAMPIAVKSGILVYERDVKWKIIVFSLFIGLMFVFTIGAIYPDISVWQRLIHSEYVKNYHQLWIALISAGLYFYLFERIRKTGDITSFIDTFKAFPIFSPVFCFGAPVFWESSLIKLGLANQNLRLLGGISFFAGIAFLVSLVIFYVANHIKNKKTAQTPAILQADGVAVKEKSNMSVSLDTVSLGLIMLGLAGLTFVTFEIAYLVVVV
ncbi:MAG TPA: hypothetical protein VF644_10160 [Pyrinomonadaceae bacterium]|jgi:hypothetical protein